MVVLVIKKAASHQKPLFLYTIRCVPLHQAKGMTEGGKSPSDSTVLND